MFLLCQKLVPKTSLKYEIQLLNQHKCQQINQSINQSKLSLVRMLILETLISRFEHKNSRDLLENSSPIGIPR